MKRRRTLKIEFHATDEELAGVQAQLEQFIDRLVFDPMGLSGRMINLIRMMKGQVGVAVGDITSDDYRQSVQDFGLDSDHTGW